MQITVKLMSGGSYSIDVDSSDTVLSLKEQITDKTGTPSSDQKLMYNQAELKDGKKTMEQVGMKSEGVVWMQYAPKK